MTEAQAPAPRVVDLMMISNFGPSDGGRETWAYQFVPRLLERWPSLRLNIFGLRRDGEPDNSALLKSAAGSNAERVDIEFFRSARRRYPTLSVLRQAPRRFAAGRHQDPDMVLGVGSAMELAVILLSPALRKARIILWLRNILIDEKAPSLPRAALPIARRVEVALLRRADLLVANGEDTADHYRRLGLAVSVIPNGVDIDRWRAQPASLSMPLHVAFIGRLAPVKGAGEFLALAKAGASERLVFHAVGDGPMRRQFEEAAERGRLVYHGPVGNHELPDLMSRFDLCVALTYKSANGGGGGVSNALLEQMAAGRAILAWDNPIFRQLLSEENAFLVPQGDVAGLLAALHAIAADLATARARAEAAKRTAEGYSFEAHIDKFIAAAAALLESRPA